MFLSVTIQSQQESFAELYRDSSSFIWYMYRSRSDEVVGKTSEIAKIKISHALFMQWTRLTCVAQVNTHLKSSHWRKMTGNCFSSECGKHKTTGDEGGMLS